MPAPRSVGAVCVNYLSGDVTKDSSERIATDNPVLVDLMSGGRDLAIANDELVRALEESFAPVRRLVEMLIGLAPFPRSRRRT